MPEEHRKTLQEFAKFVNNGVLDKELLIIYESEIAKADALLKIFKVERKKRGIFTYNVKSEANIPSANESIDNAIKFVSVIISLIEKIN